MEGWDVVFGRAMLSYWRRAAGKKPLLAGASLGAAGLRLGRRPAPRHCYLLSVPDHAEGGRGGTLTLHLAKYTMHSIIAFPPTEAAMMNWCN